MIAATCVCAVACALLVFAEYRRLASMRVVTKVIASLAFLAVGVLAWHDSAYAPWILGGLALGVIGDVALLGDGKRAFLVGLGAFLLGHIAYVVAFALIDPPVYWPYNAGLLAALPIVVALFALYKLWPQLGSMRVPVIAYVIVIVTMVIGALAIRGQMEAKDYVLWMMNHHTMTWEHRERLAVGAVLFFASDLAVARDKFMGASFVNKAWGLPAYYAGQLCIAWSLA
jgi:uncharacterized membrane protein YhhN